MEDSTIQLAQQFDERVLRPVKELFAGKDVIIDLLGLALVSGENIFLHGPPGTAKSALVREVAKRLEGRVFDYLLTRFSEPNELFGPFDIRRLRDGDLVTNTEGMLPEAEIVFLDELLNANSAILNSLLMVLNERVFRRGRETRHLPTLMVVGASNHLPEDEALQALFDRFLIRVTCDNVPAEMLPEVLRAGWRLDSSGASDLAGMEADAIRELQALIGQVDLSLTSELYVDTIHRLRHAGMNISDRRAVKLQRLVAASAVICGRLIAQPSDLWVLRYVWDTEEQQPVLKTIIDDVIESSVAEEDNVHPQAQSIEKVDAEHVARDLKRLEERLANSLQSHSTRIFLKDQLSHLSERCQWVADEGQRGQLEAMIQELWPKLETADVSG